MTDHDHQKPEITYPCRWEYKVIGRDDQAVKDAVAACVQGLAQDQASPRDYGLGFSRASGKGNYLSFKLELEVRSQTERDALFQDLSAHPAVFMVI